MSDITVLGAGSWGTALARVLADAGHRVTVWGPHDLTALDRERRHKNLPGMIIPASIRFTNRMEEAVSGAQIVILATPSVYVRDTAALAAPFMAPGQIFVSVAKGIEKDTLLTMTEVMGRELAAAGKAEGIALTALSGPSHAEEVALDLPTAVVSAGEDPDAARAVQELFAGTCLRVYTTDDLRGVELCGAVKNIIALAAGISSGLGYGDNTKAAIVTRGMAEIRRLGVAMGCREETFAGLAGIGDLFVTATSPHSRNNRCGFYIGQGLSPALAIEKVGMVVEGVNALPAAEALARRRAVDMPITHAVWRVVFDGADPRRAVMDLMNRDTRSELEYAR